jgi:Zn-dependent peptidase ImmA (M78 family)
MAEVIQSNPIIQRFQNVAPVDVTGLAEALGLNVWEDDDLPEGVSGKLFLDSEHGGYSIVVRASDAYVRRRFTVAHEIAHFLLHRNFIGNSITDDEWYRSNLSNAQEAEANRLAADILMPDALIASSIKRYGADPAVLAPLFEVSEAAMRIRLSQKVGTSA